MLMNDAETLNYVSINVEMLLAFSIFGSKQKTVSKSGLSLHFQKALAKMKCLQFKFINLCLTFGLQNINQIILIDIKKRNQSPKPSISRDYEICNSAESPVIR